jgi:F0F1-type ATP synthase membrane subunit b/b'
MDTMKPTLSDLREYFDDAKALQAQFWDALGALEQALAEYAEVSEMDIDSTRDLNESSLAALIDQAEREIPR